MIFFLKLVNRKPTQVILQQKQMNRVPNQMILIQKHTKGKQNHLKAFGNQVLEF